MSYQWTWHVPRTALQDIASTLGPLMWSLCISNHSYCSKNTLGSGATRQPSLTHWQSVLSPQQFPSSLGPSGTCFHSMQCGATESGAELHKAGQGAQSLGTCGPGCRYQSAEGQSQRQLLGGMNSDRELGQCKNTSFIRYSHIPHELVPLFAILTCAL